MGTIRRENHTLSPGFSRARKSAPDTAKPRCFTGTTSVSPREAIPRSSSLTKKRELFPGLLPAFPGSFALPHLVPKHRSPRPGSGILTRFPFDRRRHNIIAWANSAPFRTGFPYLLGSTDPCSNAVHMEPFSTSVFKVLIWIFATTTKICTSGSSDQTHVQVFYATAMALLLVKTWHPGCLYCLNGQV